MFNIILPKIHIEIEKWKYNKNYNLYVSNQGNFKDKTGETINIKVDQGGYLQVPVCNNKAGVVKYLQAHRVVMETWCPLANMWKDKLTVDHLDHNKRHNSCKNLQWVTKEENLRRAKQDLIIDDKDVEITRLKNKIKNLEDRLYNNITILAKGNNVDKVFLSWNAVKSYLIDNVNSSYNQASINTIIKNVTKASKGNKKYANLNWQIKKGDM